ncbi:BPK_collapsed_G0022550.mRNA.1.CDS.1 [Saccharomyces cerevisiae]|nr:BPK_collapsed_G0022550.mRNA.1.CDS.1 [Saccharomyces cerevisiae]
MTNFTKIFRMRMINLQLLLFMKDFVIFKKIEVIRILFIDEMNSNTGISNLLKQEKQNFARNSITNVTDYVSRRRTKCSLKFPVSELNRIYLKFKEISDFLMEREVFQRV